MPDARFDLVDSYDTAPQSDWFHTCRATKKPYVVVRTGERTADVMWDYVTLPPSCDAILMANEKFLKEQAIAIFEKHASTESSVRAKATVVFFDKLSIPQAKAAANELYALIEALVEHPAQVTDSGAMHGTGPGAVGLEGATGMPTLRDGAGGALPRFELVPTA